MEPEAGAVEVWRFGSPEETTRHERHTEGLPVRCGGETVGEIDLGEVFRHL